MSTPRMVAPDLARGAMLLLIVLAHAPLYLTGTPPVPSVTDTVVAVGSTLLVDSRAYPMFAALLGYGLVLSVTRLRAAGVSERDARRSIRRRGRWLLVFGLVHALLVAPIEILGAYGLALLLVAGLVFRPDATVRRAGYLLLAVNSVAIVLFSLGAVDDGASGPYAPGMLGHDVEGLVVRLIVWLVAVLSNVVVWPVLVALLIGVLAGRHRVLADAGRYAGLLRRLAWVGIPVAVLAAVPLVLVEQDVLPAGLAPAATLLQILSGLAGGLGYAAAFGLLGARLQGAGPPVLLRPLAAAGRRSLTCYLLQSFLLVGLLSQTFVGFGARTGEAGAALAAVLAWSASVLVATVLERFDRPGPVDALLRRLVRRGLPDPGPAVRTPG
ncbi:DUF418 domain-containing protein [Pseudonocardia sp. NPDC046786]|uniref:DUF418 domain-containing protein n=1 Tax=Pseudonocardia sp. NPDC046786 TaxID=3155471 RepID=UPI0034068994